jgi:hypothetical protein
LYGGKLRQFAAAWHKKPLYVAKDLRASININCLRGIGARYERHLDTNPVTGLLFVTDWRSNSGGELAFEKGEKRCVIRPRAGTFIAFDAREIPHEVKRLRSAGDRISIPRNFDEDPVRQPRPTELDDYLYGGMSNDKRK